MQPEGDELAPQVEEDEPAAERPAPTPVSPPAPAVSPAPVNGSAYRPVGNAAGSLAALWNDGDRQRIKARWQELQLRFIDDPHLVAGEAERLVQDAVTSLAASLDARRGQLHQQRAARGLDTENLRASLRDYREFLDRILAL
ncbi:hypothetical protein [Dactylosporangium sp. NPDC051541]|uniref:hypothetical protein n=1 Tax=Dactylosporangium sp. NPDC051541 TaxID=3363977 RepID=UPI0037A283C4